MYLRDHVMMRMLWAAGHLSLFRLACKVPPMSAYLQSLNLAVERNHAAQVVAAAADRDVVVRAAREKLRPLPDRLAEVLRGIPIELKRDGLALETLIPLLRGRRTATANPGQLGVALRQLGWRRERKWRGGDVGFSALWYPPARA